MVAFSCQYSSSPLLDFMDGVPLGGPVHEVVTGHHGGEPVEDLGLGAAEGVEDGVMGGTGKGVLAVGGHAPVDNALLLGATWVGLAPVCPHLLSLSPSLNVKLPRVRTIHVIKPYISLFSQLTIFRYVVVGRYSGIARAGLDSS